MQAILCRGSQGWTTWTMSSPARNEFQWDCVYGDQSIKAPTTPTVVANFFEELESHSTLHVGTLAIVTQMDV
jgi:hypothetical protein